MSVREYVDDLSKTLLQPMIQIVVTKQEYVQAQRVTNKTNARQSETKKCVVSVRHWGVGENQEN